jgi:glycerophosphoryl diester phosphodiesterase
VQKGRKGSPETVSKDCDVVPCLEDVVTRYSGRAYLDIELKIAGLDEEVAGLVSSLSRETYVVSSFLPEVLQSIHHRQSAIPLGFICERKWMLRRWDQMPCTVVIPERRLVTEQLVDEVHGAGKKIFVWTVNDRAEMLRFSTIGVDGIISDDTELLGRAVPRVRGSRSS